MADKKVLMVVAPKNFRDEELFDTKEVLERGGVEITLASKADKATGMLGAVTTVDKNILEVSAENYDAVVFVGGSGASVYFEDETILNLAKEAYRQCKIVAAICIAPSILANADLLEGKKVTSFPSEKENLESHGADYTGSDVEQDGKIITGKGPHAATEFGRRILENL